jgi:uncharacterized protein YtpQ (UPF0354 family)
MTLLDRLLTRMRGGPEQMRAAQAGPLQIYVERYAGLIRERHPGTEPIIEIGGTAALTRVVWTTPHGFEASQFVGNYFARYQLDPDCLDALLEEQYAAALAIGSASELRIEAPEARHAILPIIKTSGWHQVASGQIDRSNLPARLVTRPLVGDLIVAYALDTPRNMHFLTGSDLDAMAITEQGLHDIALANLARMLPQLEIMGGGGRYAARLDQNYDASMVLLFDRWRDRVPLSGTPAIAIPARNELLLCDADEPETIASLAELAAEIKRQSAYDLSAMLFVWRDGELAPLLP